jgi:hypothetical protein
MIRKIKLFRYRCILLKALCEKISDLINFPFIGSKIFKEVDLLPLIFKYHFIGNIDCLA